MSLPITVVGSLNIDLVTVTPRVPSGGETLTATSFSTGFGGKGANQAVACARLCRERDAQATSSSPRVSMTGAVGSDAFGRDFLEHLRGEGIHVEGVQIKDDKTGTAVILVEEGSGENRILLATGANHKITKDDVKGAVKEGITILQLEIPLDIVLHCLQEGKKEGRITILNPAPAVPLPDEAYQGLSHLILNETEAALLAGVAEEKLVDSIESVAKFFLDRGVETVIITLGAKGVFYTAEGQPGTWVNARSVSVVDTTAAGDTFVGAYAVYLAQHAGERSRQAIAGAVDFANRAASMTVQRSGAQSSIPFLDEVPAA